MNSTAYVTGKEYLTSTAWAQLSSDEWRVYELVARHFFASLSPGLVYLEHQASLAIGLSGDEIAQNGGGAKNGDEEMFTFTWHSVPASSQLHFAVRQEYLASEEYLIMCRALMPWRLACTESLLTRKKYLIMGRRR